MSKKLYVQVLNRAENNHIDTHMFEDEDMKNFKITSDLRSTLFFYDVKEPFKNNEKVITRSIVMADVISANYVETLKNALKIRKLEMFKDLLFDACKNKLISNLEDMPPCDISIHTYNTELQILEITRYKNCQIVSQGCNFDAGAKVLIEDIIASYESKSNLEVPAEKPSPICGGVVDGKMKNNSLSFITIECEGISVGLIQEMQELPE